LSCALTGSEPVGTERTPNNGAIANQVCIVTLNRPDGIASGPDNTLV
jgi:hypothetical protein